MYTHLTMRFDLILCLKRINACPLDLTDYLQGVPRALDSLWRRIAANRRMERPSPTTVAHHSISPRCPVGEVGESERTTKRTTRLPAGSSVYFHPGSYGAVGRDQANPADKGSCARCCRRRRRPSFLPIFRRTNYCRQGSQVGHDTRMHT